MGLLITNGEFVSFHGPDPTMVEVGPQHTGAVRFVNCAFWGPCNQIARISGSGMVGFGDCTFAEWGGKNKDRAALQIQSGSVMVRGCDFRLDRPHIKLEPQVSRGIVTGNLFKGPPQIVNQAKGTVVIGQNAHD